MIHVNYFNVALVISSITSLMLYAGKNGDREDDKEDQNAQIVAVIEQNAFRKELNKRILPACPTLLHWMSCKAGSEKIEKAHEAGVLCDLKTEYEEWQKKEDSNDYRFLERCIMSGSSGHFEVGLREYRDDPFAFMVGTSRPTTFARWAYLLAAAANKKDGCKVGAITYSKCQACYNLLLGWIIEQYGDPFKKDFKEADFKSYERTRITGIDEHYKRTPLIVAVLLERYNLVGLLLRYGAAKTMDACDIHGNTSLIYASLLGHMSIVKLLVHYGADVTVINNQGKKASQLAFEQSERNINSSAKKLYQSIGILLSKLEQNPEQELISIVQ